MSTSNTLLDSIYTQAKQADLCTSKYEFSEKIAGRSKRWLSTVISQNVQASALSLITISTNLSRYASETRKRNVIQAAKQISSIINQELITRIYENANEQKLR
jgi:hypothetical protein